MELLEREAGGKKSEVGKRLGSIHGNYEVLNTTTDIMHTSSIELTAGPQSSGFRFSIFEGSVECGIMAYFL